MKHLAQHRWMVLILSFFLISIASLAQNCTPDSSIPSDQTGVHPMPYDASTNPNGGIKDTICLGKMFSFTFTTIVGDSFFLGAMGIPLDSLSMTKKDALVNLPEGLSYSCNPPNCTFTPSSRGCVILEGTVSNKTELGDHKLFIKGKLYGNGSPSAIDLTFPSPLIAPGEYILHVSDATATECNRNSIANEANAFEMSLFPNPTSDKVFIKSNQSINKIEVFDIYGKKVLEVDGSNEFDTSFIVKGLYCCKVQTVLGYRMNYFVKN